MNSNLKSKLTHLGLPSHSLEDYKDGVELVKLVAKIPGLSPDLESRIKKTNLHQIANRVINMNIILKAIRESALCPQDIKKMTAFNVLEDQESLGVLLSWLAHMQPSRTPVLPEPENFKDEEGNGLDNLYFVSAIKHQYPQETAQQDSPQEIELEQQQEVVRPSSSAKILKPKIKTNFSDALEIKEPEVSLPRTFDPIETRQSNLPRPFSNPPLPYSESAKNKDKQNVSNFKVTPMRKQSLNQSEKKQSNEFQVLTEPQSGRIKKSSPKSKWKQLPRQLSQETASNHSSKRSNKVEKIEKDIGQIEESIRKEKKTINSIKRSSFSLASLRPKHQPVNFIQVGIVERKQLVEWLISINLLNNLAIKNYDNLHLICRNGLIFPEIINYKKGRESQLKYERNPKKSAEVHSNYKRLFEYLKEFPSFVSQLLFRYEYFVPEASEKAFWQLLSQIHSFYNNRNKHRRNSSAKVVSPSKAETSRGCDSTKRQKVYQDIRFGKSQIYQSSSKKINSKRSVTKMSIHSESSDFEVREPIERQPQITQNSQKKTTLFTMEKQMTPTEQHNEHASLLLNSSSNTYQLLKLKKQQMCTPKRHEFGSNSKNQNSHNSSINKSRVSLRNSSNSKQEPQSLPAITLQMELVALKYLKDNSYKLPLKASLHKDLFDDPLRNGTLLMLVVCKKFSCKADFYVKPNSIQDCRQNHRIAFKIIKENMPNFPKSLINLSEQIMKGQRSLFYGIVFVLVNNNNSGSPAHLDLSGSNRNIMLKTDCDRSCSFEEPATSKQYLLDWLKSLYPQGNLKNFYQVEEGIKNGILLSAIISEITGKQLKPVHDCPQYSFQYEANITKALNFLNQHKKVNTAFTWKANKIAQGDGSTIIGLLQELRKLTVPKQEQEQQKASARPNSVSFNQLLRSQLQNQNYNTLNTTFQNQPHINNSLNKPLQTTMSNHGYSTNLMNSVQKQQPASREEPLEVDWMRKLGFACDLSINSGVLLCRLIEKLTMNTIEGVNYSPNNKGEMLGNIRKALRELKKTPNGKLFQVLDEVEIYNANNTKAKQVYALIREAYKQSYAFKPPQKRIGASNLHSL